MYKVSIEVLKEAVDNVQRTSDMLNITSKGKKLHSGQINEQLEKNKKFIKLIKDNYPYE